MEYINTTKAWVSRSYCGDKLSDLSLHLFTDADFAGDFPGSRSTSGSVLALFGSSTCIFIAAFGKKQTCVSHSTPEAELVALNTGVRCEGIPALSLFDTMLGLPDDGAMPPDGDLHFKRNYFSSSIIAHDLWDFGIEDPLSSPTVNLFRQRVIRQFRKLTQRERVTDRRERAPTISLSLLLPLPLLRSRDSGTMFPRPR